MALEFFVFEDRATPRRPDLGNLLYVLDVCSVQRDHVGVLFVDGRFTDTLAPGEYAFWKGPADARVVEIDLRETMVDVSGQDIITADKVTLRLNAVVTYKIADARRAVSQTDDVRQAAMPRALNSYCAA